MHTHTHKNFNTVWLFYLSQISLQYLSSAFLWFKNYVSLEGQWNSMSHCYILPKPIMWYIMSSVSQLSHSVGSDSLWPHGLQHARLPCPSPTPRAARQASLSITNSQSLLKLMSIESEMTSNHLILCHSLLLHLSSYVLGEFKTQELHVDAG